MIVVSDSSPLITLARINCFHFLPRLYGRILISNEVYKEVAVNGAGLPGSIEVAQATWIEVRPIQDAAVLNASIVETGLGVGELNAVALAKELSATLVMIDERKARRYAQREGLPVIGCVGILEDLYAQGELTDLRGAYQRLIQHGTRVDVQTLQHSLAKFRTPVL